MRRWNSILIEGIQLANDVVLVALGHFLKLDCSYLWVPEDNRIDLFVAHVTFSLHWNASGCQLPLSWTWNVNFMPKNSSQNESLPLLVQPTNWRMLFNCFVEFYMLKEGNFFFPVISFVCERWVKDTWQKLEINCINFVNNFGMGSCCQIFFDAISNSWISAEMQNP